MGANLQKNQSHAHLLNHLKKAHHPPLNPAPQSNLLKRVQKSLHQRSQNGAQISLHQRNQNGALKSQKKRENQNGKSRRNQKSLRRKGKSQKNQRNPVENLKRAKNQAGKSRKNLRKAEIGKRNKTFVKL